MPIIPPCHLCHFFSNKVDITNFLHECNLFSIHLTRLRFFQCCFPEIDKIELLEEQTQLLLLLLDAVDADEVSAQPYSCQHSDERYCWYTHTIGGITAPKVEQSAQKEWQAAKILCQCHLGVFSISACHWQVKPLQKKHCPILKTIQMKNKNSKNPFAQFFCSFFSR